MRVITYRYNIKLNWISELAQALEGSMMKAPDHIFSGVHYFLSISPDISAMIVDGTYNETMLFQQRNSASNFLSVFYNITEGHFELLLNGESKPMGKWNYNASIIDSSLDSDYIVQKGFRFYGIAIFVRKSLAKEYISKEPKYKSSINKMFNPKKNTIVRFDRMGDKSRILINDFRKIEYGNPIFDIAFKAMIYGLISNYIDHIVSDKVFIGKVISDDIRYIINSQSILLENIEGPFPGIAILAAAACMSSTKYKELYKKIIGISPKTYFSNNKLQLAKELLESGEYSINAIAEKLHYKNASHLTKQFKEYYKILPKDYINLL